MTHTHRKTTPNNPNPTPKQHLIAPLRAAMAFLLILAGTTATAQQSSRQTAVTFGGGSTNWYNEGRFGTLIKLSDDIAIFGEAILGGGTTHINPTPAVTFRLDHCCKLGFKLGPDILITQESITNDAKITYLKAATGIFFWADVTPKASVILALDTVPGIENRPKYQASAIVAIWLHQ